MLPGHIMITYLCYNMNDNIINNTMSKAEGACLVARDVDVGGGPHAAADEARPERDHPHPALLQGRHQLLGTIRISKTLIFIDE